jgi:glucose/arabinose dehydrogenase
VLPEIWHYGLRNPWRFSFDADTGDLWIGDVGQSSREEIDRVDPGVGGLNFGWRIREGTQPFNGTDPGGLTDPVFEYTHSEGCSVTGGLVYRGGSVTALEGAYLFADFCAGEIRGLRYSGGQVIDEASLGVSLGQVAAFGRDAAGEVYVLSLGGDVVRIDE